MFVACFSVGTNSGFVIYSCDPFRETFARGVTFQFHLKEIQTEGTLNPYPSTPLPPLDYLKEIQTKGFCLKIDFYYHFTHQTGWLSNLFCGSNEILQTALDMSLDQNDLMSGPLFLKSPNFTTIVLDCHKSVNFCKILVIFVVALCLWCEFPPSPVFFSGL